MSSLHEALGVEAPNQPNLREMLGSGAATEAAGADMAGAIGDTGSELGGLLGEASPGTTLEANVPSGSPLGDGLGTTGPQIETQAETDVIDGTIELEEREDIDPEAAEQIREIQQLANVSVGDQGSRRRARRIMRELVDPQNSSPAEAQANLELIHRELGQPNFARLFYNEVGRERYKMYNHNMPILRTAEGLGMIFSSRLTSFTIQDGQDEVVAVRQGNVYVNQATGEPIILENTFNVTDFAMQGMSNTEGLTLAERVAQAQQISDQRVESDLLEEPIEDEFELESTSRAEREAEEAARDVALEEELAEAEQQAQNNRRLSNELHEHFHDHDEAEFAEHYHECEQCFDTINKTGVTLESVDREGVMTARLGPDNGVRVQIHPGENRMLPASFDYDPALAVPVTEGNLTFCQILDTATSQSVVSRQQRYRRDCLLVGGSDRLADFFGQLYPFRGTPLDETTAQSWARGFEGEGIQGFFQQIEQNAQESDEISPGHNLIDPANGRLLIQNAGDYRLATERILRRKQVEA